MTMKMRLRNYYVFSLFKLALINFNNENSKENYVNLIERKNFCLLAINCLENLINTCGNFSNLIQTNRKRMNTSS